MNLATRFSSNRTSIRSASAPLSEDQIHRVAPSIFATEKHESRSERYTYVPTIDVLKGLETEGFLPFEVMQSKCRDVVKRDFTKHMVRLRRNFDSAVVGAEIPEIILINSHDGTTSYQMLAGMFRFVCANGMVVASGSADEVRVPHKGDVIGEVIEGAYRVVNEFDKVIESKDQMKLIQLSPVEQGAFARAALSVKYPDAANVNAFPITEAQVLQPSRSADASPDLWTTFNVVQEKLVRGGVQARSANGRRTRTREVAGISQNVALNRALWQLADEMARIKTAH